MFSTVRGGVRSISGARAAWKGKRLTVGPTESGREAPGVGGDVEHPRESVKIYGFRPFFACFQPFLGSFWVFLASKSLRRSSMSIEMPGRAA